MVVLNKAVPNTPDETCEECPQCWGGECRAFCVPHSEEEEEARRTDEAMKCIGIAHTFNLKDILKRFDDSRGDVERTCALTFLYVVILLILGGTLGMLLITYGGVDIFGLLSQEG